MSKNPSPATVTNNPMRVEQNKIVEPIKPTGGKSILPKILVALGFVESLIFLANFVNLVLVIPKLQQLYTDTNIKPSNYPYVGVFVVGLFTMLAIAETIYGFRLISLQKKQGSLPAKHKRVAKIVLIATVILFCLWFVALIYSAILPIYNLHNAF